MNNKDNFIEDEEMVETNVGMMPKKDYEKLKLFQHGFSSQEEVNEEYFTIMYEDEACDLESQIESSCTLKTREYRYSFQSPTLYGLMYDYIDAKKNHSNYNFMHFVNGESIEYNILKEDAFNITAKVKDKNNSDNALFITLTEKEYDANKNGKIHFGEVLFNKMELLYNENHKREVRRTYLSNDEAILKEGIVSFKELQQAAFEDNIEVMNALNNACKALAMVRPYKINTLYHNFDNEYKKYLSEIPYHLSYDKHEWEDMMFDEVMAKWAFYDSERGLSQYNHAKLICEQNGLSIKHIEADMKAEIIKRVDKFLYDIRSIDINSALYVDIESLIRDAELAYEQDSDYPFRHNIGDGKCFDYEVLQVFDGSIDIGARKQYRGIPASEGCIIEVSRDMFDDMGRLDLVKSLTNIVRKSIKHEDIER